MSKAPAVAPLGLWTLKNLSPEWVAIPPEAPGVVIAVNPLAVVNVAFVAITTGFGKEAKEFEKKYTFGFATVRN